MRREIVEGKICGNERGYAFLIPSDKKTEDYFIPHEDLKGAMHGDTVLAHVCASEDGMHTTAVVLKVLERGVKEIVGTYFSMRTGGRVAPDERKYFSDIFITAGKGLRAKNGDKVVCKILSYPKKRLPEGIVTKVLGRQFEKNAELKSIYCSYKLPDAFPVAVKNEVADICGEITAEDLKGRLDLREEVIFTMDGADAKDFDDAVSVEKLDDKSYKLGVHIADVSHFVTEHSFTDDEAFERGTSVYFPEKVIPMLPERLSNDLCSLREGVDRLTLSCIMTIRESDGKVIDSVITPSVIRSKARLTYEKVQAFLDGDENAVTDKTIKEKLVLCNRLCDILSARRKKNGSIDLDIKESVISVNSDGSISISPTRPERAMKIIEEFMVIANVTVAEFVYYLGKPFVYRVHGTPDTDRLENFYRFLQGLGIAFKRHRDGVFPKDFQKILEDNKDKPEFTVINRVMLKSMQKARYSPDNIGHFGLSEKCYCHFTSPIRRYPDLTVHRIVKEILNTGTLRSEYENFVDVASKKSSERERIAEDAERAVDDFYKLMYIDGFTGCDFCGVISGVSSFGVFVELENGVEGLVKLTSLNGKRFTYDDRNYLLTDGKTTYRLGQRLKIRVAGVSVTERRAEFVIIDDYNSCKGNQKVVK